MPAFKHKIEVTKEQLTTVLLFWLMRRLSEKRIQQIAEAQNPTKKKSASKLFGIDITNRRNLEEVLGRLFVFNMWSVVASCEKQIKNKDLCNEYLDMFHLLVFKQYLRGEDKGILL